MNIQNHIQRMTYKYTWLKSTSIFLSVHSLITVLNKEIMKVSFSVRLFKINFSTNSFQMLTYLSTEFLPWCCVPFSVLQCYDLYIYLYCSDMRHRSKIQFKKYYFTTHQPFQGFYPAAEFL